jgi:hypothetical protein
MLAAFSGWTAERAARIWTQNTDKLCSISEFAVEFRIIVQPRRRHGTGFSFSLSDYGLLIFAVGNFVCGHLSRRNICCTFPRQEFALPR